MKNFLLFLLMVFSTGCAFNYRYIDPLDVSFLMLRDETPLEVEISFKYNVLKEAGNRKYAKTEKRTGVSLLAVRIENNGTDTLYFPEDFGIKLGQEYVFMLTKDETVGVFKRGATSDFGASETGRLEELFLSLILVFVDAGNRGNMNRRFAKEMDEFYLWPSTIAPGVSTVGLLGVEVEKGTPLLFVLEK